MKKPELLSPVGNMDCLKAAIQGGCDAVYLGGYAFGARSFAGNFSNEEMIQAVSYAHLYGVKVYVTVNTLVYESEVECFLKYIDFLYKNQVDAIIIQDLGMMDLVHQTYPDFEIHASTQMHIHNIEGVKAVEHLGVSRVVLARETDIDTISKIRENSPIELEIFVHGALCFCYSGQCLMSSMIGGRSGNRGTCSQCCRMPYTLYDQDKKIKSNSYILSPKDLNSLQFLGQLIDIGIDSLKIEGRMKRPEYVYYATHLYRKAIDSYCMNQTITITEEENNILKKLFHREFTKGFLFHEQNENWLNPKRPNHVGITVGEVVQYDKGWVTCKLTYPVHQNDGIRILGSKEDKGCVLNKIYQKQKLVNGGEKGDTISFFLKGQFCLGDTLVLTSDQKDLMSIQKEISECKRKVSITGKVTLKIGSCMQYQVSDGKNVAIVTGNIPVSIAQNAPVTKNRIQEQLQKLGDTVYELNTLEIEMDTNLFIPMQELNQIRRKSVEVLNQMRIYQRPYHKESYHLEVPEWIEEAGYTVRIHDYVNYEKIKHKNIKQIYVEEEELYQKIKKDNRVIYILPRVMTQFEKKDGTLMAGELGSIFYYHPSYSDFSFNVTNSYTVAFLHAHGINRVTLSLELKDFQIKQLVLAYQKRYHKHPNLEVLHTNFPEVMISKFDLPRYFHTKKELSMKDEKEHQFTIRKIGNYTKIYYHKGPQKRKLNWFFEHQIYTICLSDLDLDYYQYLV